MILHNIILPKGEIQISQNEEKVEIQFINCKSNPQTRNKVIEVLLPVLHDTCNKENLLKGKTLDEAIVVLGFLINLKNTLISLKSENCSRGNLLSKFEENLRGVPWSLNSRIQESTFDYPEKLVLGQVSGFFSEISSYDLDQYYDVKTQVLSLEYKKFVDSVLNYDYYKYDLDTTLLENFKSTTSSFEKAIIDFQELLKIEGDNLINYSRHLMTRRNISAGVYSWVYEYQSFLKTKGIKAKEKKLNSVEKTRVKVNKDLKDYIRLFKNGSQDEACEAIQHLDWNTLSEFLDKASTRSDSNRRRHILPKVLSRCFELDNGENWKRIYEKAKGSYVNIPLSYILKIAESDKNVTKEEIIALLIKTHSYNRDNLEELQMPSQFYERFLKDMPFSESLNIRPWVTHHIFKRISNEEICGIVKRMAGLDGRFLLLDLEVESDKLEIKIEQETIGNLDVNLYPLIKEYLPSLSDKTLFSSLIAKAQDKELAISLLKTTRENDNNLCNLLTFEERFQILKGFIDEKENVNAVFNRYGNESLCGLDFFSNEEHLRLFGELLKLENSLHLKVRLNSLFGGYYDNSPKKEFENLILKEDTLLNLNYNMSKEVRKHLLLLGATITSRNEIQDFTREDLESCSPQEEAYNMMVQLKPDLLTKVELEHEGELSNKFLKDNLELFSSTYLKEKFKDESFKKEFIGNRVHRRNKTASEILERKLQAK